MRLNWFSRREHDEYTPCDASPGDAIPPALHCCRACQRPQWKTRNHHGGWRWHRSHRSAGVCQSWMCNSVSTSSALFHFLNQSPPTLLRFPAMITRRSPTMTPRLYTHTYATTTTSSTTTTTTPTNKPPSSLSQSFGRPLQGHAAGDGGRDREADLGARTRRPHRRIERGVGARAL